jgi:C_GCAxxG_C_C family probable redox protein
MSEDGTSKKGNEELAILAGERAENIFTARGFCCSEAVLSVLNAAFSGGLEPALAVQLVSGFCHGQGGAGCVCGALSGAQVGLGLLLNPKQPGGMRKKEFEKISREMHNRFKERFGATCCRVLLKKSKEKKGASCRELTGGGAELAAGLLLAARPELAGLADYGFLKTRESKAEAPAGPLPGGN